MEIVYYFDLDLQIAPVKKFLLRYNLASSDNAKRTNRKIKILEQTKLYYQDFIKNQNYEEYK